MNLLRARCSRTKLYWGLAIICLIGALASPHTSSGRNIFLSYQNLTDVLRQVSITGLVATGMTIVILLGGIDLSVGSVMGCLDDHLRDASDLSGMDARPDHGRARRDTVDRRGGRPSWPGSCSMGSSAAATSTRGGGGRLCWAPGGVIAFPSLLGLAAGAMVGAVTASQVSTKFGVLAVLLVTPCFALMLGAINGALIVAGRLQPFIATLAMMVSALGIGRLTGGQDFAVIPVYTGTNATEAFEVLRSMVWGLIPMPSIFFLVAIVFFGAILRFTTFGRYVYAIGGNVEAAKLSGVKVAQVQFAAYVISGLLAGVAASCSSPSTGREARRRRRP